MTSPKLDSTITIGNIVSWALVVGGFVAGYIQLREATAQNIKDVQVAHYEAIAAKELALKVKDESRSQDQAITASIANLTTDIAVIKNDVAYIKSAVVSNRSKSNNSD